MSRPLRFQPEEWSIFFVTARCIHSRFLLRPSPRVNKLIIGVLARAVERFDIKLYGERCQTNIVRVHTCQRFLDLPMLAALKDSLGDDHATALAMGGDRYAWVRRGLQQR